MSWYERRLYIVKRWKLVHVSDKFSLLSGESFTKGNIWKIGHHLQREEFLNESAYLKYILLRGLYIVSFTAFQNTLSYEVQLSFQNKPIQEEETS